MDKQKIKLSILIASIIERNDYLARNLYRFDKQIKENGFEDVVELVVIVDNKEMSIGKKRQSLLEKSKGEWVVFFDDDDKPSENYIRLIMEAIMSDPDADCCGINGVMTTNGSNLQTWVHRLGMTWIGDGRKKLRSGFDYERNIIHFNPVKREKALAAGFKDMRFGEDKDYSDRLNKLLKKEVFIAEPLFHYQYSNAIPHKQKYGIK